MAEEDEQATHGDARIWRIKNGTLNAIALKHFLQHVDECATWAHV